MNLIIYIISYKRMISDVRKKKTVFLLPEVRDTFTNQIITEVRRQYFKEQTAIKAETIQQY